LRELGSAPVPDPAPDDHVRGALDALLAIEYADFECPYCAALSVKLERFSFRRVFRHFPRRASHPRAWPAACAAEAAGLQGRFWEMHDRLFANQARLEDPHLWRHAEELELDLDRFERDRRSEAVRLRVQRDFDSGLRAGVVSTPALFIAGRMLAGRIDEGELRGLRP
jgi:protein-disulfide isomerase